MTTHTAALNKSLFQLALSFGLVTTSTQWWTQIRMIAQAKNWTVEEAGHRVIATAMYMETCDVEGLCPDCLAPLFGEYDSSCSSFCGYSCGR